MSSPTSHTDYRAAKDSVAVHRRAQADAEVAVADWEKAHRGVPTEMLYDPDGTPKDPEQVALLKARDKAYQDTEWCRGLVVACGEKVKGESFTMPDRAAMTRARAEALAQVDG